jgi:hypothetical protein
MCLVNGMDSEGYVEGAKRTTAIVNVALKSEGNIVARSAEMQALLKDYTAGHCRHTGFVC